LRAADWVIIGLYFVGMAGIGIWAFRRVHDTHDFFVAGGKMPWWLAGICHHMSGYSAAVFVAHAGVAYTYGFTLYVWLALPIAIAVFVGAFVVAPRWARLRIRLNIGSPTEYLALRFNVPTEQLLVWSGVILKVFDVGAKWASIAVILKVFTGIPLGAGILISALFSVFYIVLGGLWAVALTELAQFFIQLGAGIAMFVVVLNKLGGFSAVTGIWKLLPPSHSQLFNGPFTLGFGVVYLLISFLSYNGGTWSLAQRYLASPTGSEARRAAYLSAGLWLFWPLILFFPMWAAPLLFPHLPDPTQSYSVMALNLLPSGLVGAVLASLFAHTMAMVTSDINVIAAVVTRDILPTASVKFRNLSPKGTLKAARLVTLAFTLATVIIALKADSFGGILSLLILWFGALLGPTAVPMILGLLVAFRRSNARAAILSWSSGIVAFGVAKYALHGSMTLVVAAPVVTSLVVFILFGWLIEKNRTPEEVTDLLEALRQDPPAPFQSRRADHSARILSNRERLAE